MEKNEAVISWRGSPVGRIVDLKIDNFDVYGKWVANNSFQSGAFLRHLEEVGEAIVRIGFSEPKWLGTVEVTPDEEIEIKIRPNLERAWEDESGGDLNSGRSEGQEFFPKC